MFRRLSSWLGLIAGSFLLGRAAGRVLGNAVARGLESRRRYGRRDPAATTEIASIDTPE